jgi:Uma2 family endonuclease
MSTVPDYRPHYTVEDYRQWDGDWELWHGTAVSMTPSPFGRHAFLLAQAAKVLGNALDQDSCNAVVLAEIDWIVSSDTVVRPDLTIVCGGAPDRHVESAPALVVEILSDSTRERDQTVKKQLYQGQRVPWLLLIDPDSDGMLAFRLDEAGSYVEVKTTDSLSIDICSDCSLTVEPNRLLGR